MSIITEKTVKVFNMNSVRQGDFIRAKRSGEARAINGLITKITDDVIDIIYCNGQSHSASFLQIKAADAAVGVWDITWSPDLNVVYVHPGG